MDEDEDVSDHIGVSTAGRVRTRSGRAVSNERAGFTVMDGKERPGSPAPCRSIAELLLKKTFSSY